MEVAAVEVVTFQPDPVVSVAGRFEQFKRDFRRTKAQSKSMQGKRQMAQTGAEAGM
jgi:hypothetical protein